MTKQTKQKQYYCGECGEDASHGEHICDKQNWEKSFDKILRDSFSYWLENRKDTISDEKLREFAIPLFKQFISKQITLAEKRGEEREFEELELKNPYPEPLGSSALGYPDNDEDKRDGYSQAIKDIKDKLKKIVNK